MDHQIETSCKVHGSARYQIYQRNVKHRINLKSAIHYRSDLEEQCGVLEECLSPGFPGLTHSVRDLEVYSAVVFLDVDHTFVSITSPFDFPYSYF